MKVAIIDDEKEFREILGSRLIKTFEGLGINFQISKYESLIDYSKDDSEFDYILLDILFNGEACFKQINKYIKGDMRKKIIFVTSQDHLVYDACHLKPFDFIRKDFILDEIECLVDRLVNSYNDENKEFEFDIDSKKVQIHAHNIMYFEVSVNDLTIITKQMIKLKCRYSLKKLQEYIDRNNIQGFVKINKSMIINTKFCTDIKNDKVEIDGDIVLSIAVNRRNKIRNEIIKQIIQLY
ncbi:MAG: LytTR family transcriptional regulator DNA-binding domain-containing protein [Anaerorhabdus sp.]|uniref:LytR/AlgR family response regulator transcription factor n=1 Tax=Anaerorhabdus sp. TaxID=1872524 RepID=UPI002FC7134E